MIKIGDKIPAILGKDQDGNEITAEGLKGNKVILYFYPKDNTSGLLLRHAVSATASPISRLPDTSSSE